MVEKFSKDYIYGRSAFTLLGKRNRSMFQFLEVTSLILTPAISLSKFHGVSSIKTK